MVIDSIISKPGMLLPWKEMVQICKDEDVWSVIDAAHSIGQELDLDLEKVAPVSGFLSKVHVRDHDIIIELSQMVVWRSCAGKGSL